MGCREGAGNPSAGNGFALGQNPFLYVHACHRCVYVCGEDHEGRPCHWSTSLLGVSSADYAVISRIDSSG